MSNAKRDQNHVPVMIGVSSVDGVTPTPPYVDPTTHRLLVDNANSSGITSINTDTTAAQIIAAGTGITVTDNGTGTHTIASTVTGTVTAVSVASANGVSGSSSGGATPALTIALGAIVPSSVNGLTISTSTGTLTVVNGKTLTVNKSVTIDGTDSTTMTFPATSATIARTDAAQTFTGTQTFSQANLTANAITSVANAATVPITSGRNIVTNNSAATLTVTLTTTSAVNMQTCIVQILDATAAAQTITWVNTENSGVTAPTTSNGSTTLPLTIGFIFNAATSKWRCVASA